MKLLLLALETGKIGENDVMSLIQTGLECKLFNKQDVKEAVFGKYDKEIIFGKDGVCSSTRYRFQRGCYSKMSPAMKRKISSLFGREEIDRHLSCCSSVIQRMEQEKGSRWKEKYNGTDEQVRLNSYCLKDEYLADFIAAIEDGFRVELLSIISVGIYSSSGRRWAAVAKALYDAKTEFCPRTNPDRDDFYLSGLLLQMLRVKAWGDFYLAVKNCGIPKKIAERCERRISSAKFYAQSTKQCLLDCIKRHTV